MSSFSPLGFTVGNAPQPFNRGLGLLLTSGDIDTKAGSAGSGFGESTSGFAEEGKGIFDGLASMLFAKGIAATANVSGEIRCVVHGRRDQASARVMASG